MAAGLQSEGLRECKVNRLLRLHIDIDDLKSPDSVARSDIWLVPTRNIGSPTVAAPSGKKFRVMLVISRT
jgi:hypothetical protein